MKIEGKMRGPDGDLLGHAWSVGAFVHGKGKNLGWDRLNSNGYYKFSICKSKRLKHYAGSHSGKIDLDMVARRHKKKKSATLFKSKAIALSNKNAKVKGKFKKIEIFRASRPPRSPLDAPPTAARVATGDTAIPATTHGLTVMRIQAIKQAESKYQLKSSSLKSVAAEAMLGGGAYGVTGSMTIGGSKSFYRREQLKATNAKPFRARFIRPQLEVEGKYTCYSPSIKYQAYVGAEDRCTVTSSAAWNGDVKYKKTRFKTCNEGQSYLSFNSNNMEAVGASRGASYEASTGANGPLGSFMVKTVYGEDTYYEYVLAQDKRRDFCLAGAGATISESAALYLEVLKDSDGECDPAASTLPPCVVREEDDD